MIYFSTHFRCLPPTDVIVVINIFSEEGYLKNKNKKITIDQVNNGRIVIINNIFILHFLKNISRQSYISLRFSH